MIHRYVHRATTRHFLIICAWAAVVTLAASHALAGSDEQAKKEKEKKAAESAAASRKLHENFFARLNEAFIEQIGTPAIAPPDPKAPPIPPRRGSPAPFNSPPYPDGEWQEGGVPCYIGDPGISTTYPLMQAFYDGPNGEAIQKSRIQLYGWVDISGNVSSSHNTTLGQSNNFPAAYDLRANRVELNQFVLYFERVPDTMQTDHIDWGFRYSFVYGLDYRYMISYGFLSDQLVKRNNYYGFDMPMMYFDWYIPKIFEGMTILVGRVISEADIEAQLAPNNLMSSHSLLYTYDPYTQWGVFTTTRLNDQWTFQAGMSAENDTAPWIRYMSNQLTGTVMIQWESPGRMDSIYGGANAFNSARWGYQNIQQYVATWTHKFNEKVWISTEGWYMYQHQAKTGPTPEVPYVNASFPVRAGYAPEEALLNYAVFLLAPNTFFTIRNEIFDDVVGQRTGYATIYSEHSVGLTWWPNKLMTIRPELRFEHSYADRAYDNGLRKNQVMASCDVVFHF